MLWKEVDVEISDIQEHNNPQGKSICSTLMCAADTQFSECICIVEKELRLTSFSASSTHSFIQPSNDSIPHMLLVFTVEKDEEPASQPTHHNIKM